MNGVANVDRHDGKHPPLLCAANHRHDCCPGAVGRSFAIASAWDPVHEPTIAGAPSLGFGPRACIVGTALSLSVSGMATRPKLDSGCGPLLRYATDVQPPCRRGGPAGRMS